MLINVLLGIDQLVAQELFEMPTDTLQFGNPIDRVARHEGVASRRAAC